MKFIKKLDTETKEQTKTHKMHKNTEYKMQNHDMKCIEPNILMRARLAFKPKVVRKRSMMVAR